MESIAIAQTILYFTLTILVIILSVAGIFLIKFLLDLSRLTVNLDETTTLVKHELEPTLTELKETLKSLNSIAGATDEQVENVRNILSKVMSIPLILFGQVRSLSGGFVKGLVAGAQLFSKRK